MKTVRRVSQVCFFALFVLLFFQTNRRVDWASGGMDVAAWGPADLFLRIDPLLGWTALIGSGSLLIPVLVWTLPVVALTLLFGRAFCGWVCPLGTCIDGADRLMRRKKLRRTDREVTRPRLKYYILAGLALTALFGSQLVWVLDPIALLTRGLTLGVFGPLNWVAQAAAGIPGLGWAAQVGSGLFPERPAVFRSGALALLVLAAILAGGYFARRFWCRSLCPLGALLGLLGRFPLFRRRVGAACTACSACGIDCKMGAIGDKGRRTVTSECIFCYSCAELCRQDAIRMIAPGGSRHSMPLDLDRRRLLAGFGLGAIWGVSARAATATRSTRDGASHIVDKHLIRPPGSVAESLFTERCARCGACMKVCPTNGLQPAIAEAGLGGIWTPVLAPRIGECSQNCNLCGQVCPTDAIEAFEIAEKEHLYIGRAAINRSTCIVWESGKQCLVCDEVCSYSAIYWLDEGGGDVTHEDLASGGEGAAGAQALPYVDPARCVGCGICEYNCPAGGPDAAIRVTCDGDKRHLSRAGQKAWQKDNWVDREGKPEFQQI